MNALPIPVLLALWAGLVGFCAWYVVRGVMVGRIKFIAGIVSPEFIRIESPVGYWISVAWDLLLTTVAALPLIVIVWSALR